MAAQPEYFNRWDLLEDKWSEQNLAHLVDLETGTQDTRCYTDEAVYRRELERIFARCWICVGHDSQIQEPGDYFTTTIGEDPVIVTRHRDKSIHVMLNQCRHRGLRLCRGDYGNAPSFTCSYHGWCYGTDGSLLGMPHREQPKKHFNQADWGLNKVAQVDTYRGLIFATWDPDRAVTGGLPRRIHLVPGCDPGPQ